MMPVESKARSRSIRHRNLLIASFIIVVLVVSLFVYVSIDNGVVHVKNELGLVKAIDNAKAGMPVGVPMVIVLDRDIFLTSPIIIPANKDITLTSNSETEFYKLIGADNRETLIVADGGVLRLDGICVTHEEDAFGCGVSVASSGTLYLYSGEISGNTDIGGGVWNKGVFMMFDGVISGNTGNYGGGVRNDYEAAFVMEGGAISDNSATFGGGVYNQGSFNLWDGVITDNNAIDTGGGVYNRGIFKREYGDVSGNTAIIDGDIYGWVDNQNEVWSWISGRYVDSSGYYIEFTNYGKIVLFLKEDMLGNPMHSAVYGSYNTVDGIHIHIGYLNNESYCDGVGTISVDQREISIFNSIFIKQ